MEGIYHKEWSTALGREMEFKVYGSAGVPVLAFPCGGGRFYDWEDHGMPEAAGWLIEHGRVQLFCADSIDHESLLADGIPPRRRAEMQEKYFCYVTNELAPRILALNHAANAAQTARADAQAAAKAPAKAGAAPKPVLWAAGADLGAYHAVNCRLRRPGLFAGAIGLSGRYDAAGRLGGAGDDLALRNDPLASLAAGLPGAGDLAALRAGQFVLCAGQGQDAAEPAALASTRALEAALQAAGIPAAAEAWGQDVTHDWYWWARAFDVFTNRLFS